MLRHERLRAEKNAEIAVLRDRLERIEALLVGQVSPPPPEEMGHPRAEQADTQNGGAR